MLADEGGVDNCGNTAEYAEKPDKMIYRVVTLAEKHGKSKHKAGHTAKAVGNDAIPTCFLISEHLGKSVGNYGNKQQKGYALK